jgi:hypothetical protein
MKILGLALALTVAVLGGMADADEIAGEDQFICSIGEVTMCDVDDGCETGPPWQFNIPDFIVFDLEARLLKTTEASHENRQTPILELTREDGLVVVQGLEMGRAFSFNIEEASGILSASAARPGSFSGAFGVCTPIPAGGE